MSAQDPFSLEGMLSTITVLRLSTPNLDELEATLRTKIAQLPGFFGDAPVALDLSDLEGTDDDDEERERIEVPLADLATRLRNLSLVPVGIRHLRQARRAEARRAGLAALKGMPKKGFKAEETERRSGEDRRKLQVGSSLVIKAPLRSGQVVYAEQRDVVVLAPINPGAELIADGSIHAYAPIRGRALAGAHGDEEARIFCRSLEADLVAIAGNYLQADDMPASKRKKPVQIHLENGELVFRDL